MVYGFKKSLKFIEIIEDTCMPMIKIVPKIIKCLLKTLMNKHFCTHKLIVFV